MSKIIIGFTGKAGAGKTTAARILAQERGFTVLSFASPIKAMARAFGLTAADMTIYKEVPHGRLNGKTPRQFQQMLGTEFGRNLIGPDVWLASWHDGLSESMVENFGDILVATDDCRFENEAAAIRAEGGIVVEIQRDGAGSASGGSHTSEAGVVADLSIFNDGTEAFTAQILGLLDRHFAQEAL